ncbi:MAG TPA: FecR family protein [Prosthecobacter sp.]|nr:FecR family protein [Prosthecobacter sp.]
MYNSLCCYLLGCSLIFGITCCGQTAVAKVGSAHPFAASGEVTSGSTSRAAEAKISKKKDSQANVLSAAKPGQIISTGSGAGVSVALGEEVIMGTARLGPDTEVKIPDEKDAGHSLELLKGQLFLNINADLLRKRGKGEFRLKTPAALLAVKGTKFFAIIGQSELVGAHEGTVGLSLNQGKQGGQVKAGTLVEITISGASQPRVMTADEIKLDANYEKAALASMPLIILRTNQRNSTKDGAFVIWSDPKAYLKKKAQGNAKSFKGRTLEYLPPTPTGEKADLVMQRDGVLRYSMQNLQNPQSDEKHYYEMTADLQFRGDARVYDDKTPPLAAISFLLRRPGWSNLTDAAVSFAASSFGSFSISRTPFIITDTDTPHVQKVLYYLPKLPLGAAGAFGTKRQPEKLSDLNITATLDLPATLQPGKTCELEMWDFRLVFLPK